MATGWRQLDGAWYYFNGDGRMATGMIDAGGIHYYLDPSDGRMVAGRSIEINGTVYQAGADGALSVQSQENSDSNQNSQDPGNINTGNNVSGSNTDNTGNTGNNVQITPVNPSEGSSGSSNSDSSSDDQKVTGKNGGPGVKKDSANTGNSSEITTGQAPG
jgi:hypothetical protein